MRFRRLFKNVPARRWHPIFHFADILRWHPIFHFAASTMNWRGFDELKLKRVTDILLEPNEILDELGPSPFRPVVQHVVGGELHGHWHAQSQDGTHYWCYIDKEWRMMPVPGEIPEAWRTTS